MLYQLTILRLPVALTCQCPKSAVWSLILTAGHFLPQVQIHHDSFSFRGNLLYNLEQATCCPMSWDGAVSESITSVM